STFRIWPVEAQPPIARTRQAVGSTHFFFIPFSRLFSALSRFVFQEVLRLSRFSGKNRPV
ncbi:MAG: hypothetical protein U0M13_08490, partial [Desulfovibrio fairfieldensis]|nr:hypothetical protein [Desulfovibrio fairfieldensis]